MRKTYFVPTECRSVEKLNGVAALGVVLTTTGVFLLELDRVLGALVVIGLVEVIVVGAVVVGVVVADVVVGVVVGDVVLVGMAVMGVIVEVVDVVGVVVIAKDNFPNVEYPLEYVELYLVLQLPKKCQISDLISTKSKSKY